MISSRCSLGSFVFVLLASVSTADNGPSAIAGTITDWDEVPIGKAEIQAKCATGKQFQATSSATGDYTLKELPAGTYEITVTAEGMRPFKKQNLALQPGQALRLDVRMEDYATLNTLGEGRGYIAGLISPHAVPPGPSPRTPDGKPDFSGVWRAVRTVSSDKPEMLPWAEALTKKNLENLRKDWSFTHCLPAGATMEGEYLPYRVVQTGAIIALIYEDDMPRQIHLDGRPHPKNWDPTYVGHSVGKWEGDELVVDTVGMNDKTWIDSSGHPHTDQLHITERYRRPDLGHLEVQITVEDPGAYKKPWTIQKVSDLAASSEEVGQYICAENNQDLAHLVGK
jgi:hypothetical protein